MSSMRKRRLLLASSALATVIGCGGHDKKPRIYANPKGPHYAAPDAGAGSADGGVEGAGSGSDEIKPPEEPVHGNPKGSLYDRGTK